MTESAKKKTQREKWITFSLCFLLRYLSKKRFVDIVFRF